MAMSLNDCRSEQAKVGAAFQRPKRLFGDSAVRGSNVTSNDDNSGVDDEIVKIVTNTPTSCPPPASAVTKVDNMSRFVLDCVDCHAGGEPARVVVGGLPPVPGCTSFEKRIFMMEHLDWIRKVLLLEPRGYPCQNVNYIFDPLRDEEAAGGKSEPGQHASLQRSTSSSSQGSRSKRGNGLVQVEQEAQQEDRRRPSFSETSHRRRNNIRFVIGEQGKIYPAMSGHNTICVATALLECGIIPMKEPITRFTLEAPAGSIDITANCCSGKAQSIKFRNEPSFVEMLDVKVTIPAFAMIGKAGASADAAEDASTSDDGPKIRLEGQKSHIVSVDIAYGGMWYGVVDADSIGLKLDKDNGKEICRVGEIIKVATREQHPVQHPLRDYPGIDIIVFRDGRSCCNIHRDVAGGNDRTNTDTLPAIRSRNAVVMSNQILDWKKPETWTGMIDRSPCGTGTCAVMAVMHARGDLQIGQKFIHESIIGSTFVGTLIAESDTAIQGKHVVIPEIEGSAYITQYSKVVVDPTDPFQTGFRVGDIW